MPKQVSTMCQALGFGNMTVCGQAIQGGGSLGTSLAVQCLGLCLPMRGVVVQVSIPGWGAKILQASPPKNQDKTKAIVQQLQ